MNKTLPSGPSNASLLIASQYNKKSRTTYPYVLILGIKYCKEKARKVRELIAYAKTFNR